MGPAAMPSGGSIVNSARGTQDVTLRYVMLRLSSSSSSSGCRSRGGNDGTCALLLPPIPTPDVVLLTPTHCSMPHALCTYVCIPPSGDATRSQPFGRLSSVVHLRQQQRSRGQFKAKLPRWYIRNCVDVWHKLAKGVSVCVPMWVFIFICICINFCKYAHIYAHKNV